MKTFPQQALSLRILGIPMDLGQNRRGVDMGPSALRYAGLIQHLQALGHQVVDLGNVAVPDRNAPGVLEAPQKGEHPPLRHYAAVVAACQSIYTAARACAEHSDIPIFLGGDHSIAIGTIAGMSSAGELGVIWVDAHADFNTPHTSPSGNIHGMPVAALIGMGDPQLVNLGHPGAKLLPQNIVQIGIRDLDRQEREALRNSGITVFTMRDIDELGMAAVMRLAIEKLARLSRIHVSFDMDSLDPSLAAGVGTPVRGGLRYREAHLLMEMLAETGKVCSLDLVEVNPLLDVRNNTADLAVDLVDSLFGKRIL